MVRIQKKNKKKTVKAWSTLSDYDCDRVCRVAVAKFLLSLKPISAIAFKTLESLELNSIV